MADNERKLKRRINHSSLLDDFYGDELPSVKYHRSLFWLQDDRQVCWYGTSLADLLPTKRYRRTGITGLSRKLEFYWLHPLCIFVFNTTSAD